MLERASSVLRSERLPPPLPATRKGRVEGREGTFITLRYIGGRARTGSSSDQSPCSTTWPFGKRGANFLAERSHHPVVAVIAKQHHADQGRQRRAADLAKRFCHIGTVLRFQVGEGAAADRGEMRQGAADVVAVALHVAKDVVEYLVVVGAGHIVDGARGNDHAGQRAQVADLIVGEVLVLHGNRPQSNRLARRCLMLSAM